MQQITLEFIVQLGIGLALWIGALLIAVVPENRAKIAKLLHGIVKSFQQRSPIVAVRYVDENEDGDLRTDTRTDGQYQYEADTDAENGDTENEVVPYHSVPSVDADSDLISHLAGLQHLNGKWRLSANAICAAVGGSRAEVLETVRKVRASNEPVKADPAEPFQFDQVGKRQQFVRTDVKPIR